MADIKLMNSEGQYITYTGVDTLTAPLADNSGIAEFKEGGGSSSIYKFYDSNGVELTDHTVTGLANAVTYDKGNQTGLPVGGRIFFIDASGTEGVNDKFYVYNTSAYTSSITWSDAACGTDIWLEYNNGIGQGKANNQAFFNTGFNDGCFSWARNLTISGCSDWFVPTCGEQAALFGKIIDGTIVDSTVEDWIISQYLWTSVEYAYNPEFNALFWNYDTGLWDSDYKNDRNACFALRSF